MTGRGGDVTGRGLDPFGLPGWWSGLRRGGRQPDPALAGALADARDTPDGEARSTELERIAAHADATGDDRTAVAARFALIDAYLLHGERWRLVEPVRRCLAAADRRPGLLAEGQAELLRRYQWYAVEALLGSPRVGLDQARSMLDDLAARAAGDPAAVAELHCRIADHLGDEPTARRWYDRWSTADPGPVGGCPDCAPARRAELLAGWGDHRAALDAVRDTVDGAADCTEQPERTLAAGLLSWLRAGEPERAAEAHVRAYRRHRRERAAFPLLAAHLRWCVLAGHPARGLDVLAEQLPRLDRSHDDLSAMEFAAAGALVCALAVEAGLGGRTVHRPAYGVRPAAELDVATLGATLLGVATALAGSFDARNGTGHQSGRIASWLAERPTAAPVPLPPDEDPDDDGNDDGPPDEDPPADGEPRPLSLAMITAVLDRRGDRYDVDARGAVTGRWGGVLIQFRRGGERGEIFQARSVASRRLPADRLVEAYAFCNAWNHDRLLPKAYVHEQENELMLAGHIATDLAHGVAPAQLAVLLDAAVDTGVAYAEAVAALP
ncbi:YbjN domain-containing protein [Micromonospora peucetia]|uniref:YbjN domain-containing protein n=1 Tax=Micromonospora peucetia TaxID=47871 RepID=A0ABZ1EFV8_9ACTN|nr:YbjN domain-containing protein [Micromonospora peucetia]MCX4386026.1 YbjN domain-containing protein [Micromonospora peucetia]WSA33392.1 YbjN domain-containing protein [Micromonospora peucetia]